MFSGGEFIEIYPALEKSPIFVPSFLRSLAVALSEGVSLLARHKFLRSTSSSPWRLCCDRSSCAVWQKADVWCHPQVQVEDLLALQQIEEKSFRLNG